MGIVLASVVTTSCQRGPAYETRTEAHFLLDSVAALPHVVHYASAQLDSARASIASADSLMSLDRGPLARIYYAEGMIHSLLAVIDAEEAQSEARAVPEETEP
jgi:hypothetical protein